MQPCPGYNTDACNGIAGEDDRGPGCFLFLFSSRSAATDCVINHASRVHTSGGCCAETARKNCYTCVSFFPHKGGGIHNLHIAYFKEKVSSKLLFKQPKVLNRIIVHSLPLFLLYLQYLPHHGDSGGKGKHSFFPPHLTDSPPLSFLSRIPPPPHPYSFS